MESSQECGFLELLDNRGYSDAEIIKRIKEAKKHPEILNLKRKDGRTLLILAAMQKRTEVAIALINARADTTIVDKKNNTACDYLYHYNDYEAIKKLKEVCNIPSESLL